MKKKVFSISFIILLGFIVVFTYYKVNYKTLDQAISESSVPIDEIFHTTDYKGHTIIFYGN